MKVTIRKIGNFYHVFDEDVYILYYLFHYKIYQGKCGFPKSAYNKVIQKLEECRISYENMIDHESKDFGKKNQYLRFVQKGKKKMEFESRKKNIFEEAKKLSVEELDELLGMMENYICER